MMIRISLITLLVTAAVIAPAAAQTAPVTAFSRATLDLLAGPQPQAEMVFGVRQPADPAARDSRLNGFLIGFVAGAVPGVLVGMGLSRYCENESANCSYAVPLFGGLFGVAGGGIGYVIDSAIHSQSHSVRPLPSGPRMRFSFKF